MPDSPHDPVPPNLEQALLEIEHLQQEKRKVISIVSHDLKSPLNRLFALLQLLQMDNDNLNPQQKDYIEKMHIVLADSMDMIRNLVDYRNIENNKIEMSITSLSLREFVQSTLKGFKSIADKKGIALSVESDDVIVNTDKNCLQRSLNNIISNGIKFSFPNKKVWVRAYKDGENISIDVEDEAFGFKPEELSNLFQKFQRFTARPTGGESSTGLGLFIAQAMAERIGGKISCENQEGIGAIFKLTFPVNYNQLNR